MLNNNPYSYFCDLIRDNKNQFNIYSYCKKSSKEFVGYFVNKLEDGSIEISETSYTNNCIGVISCGIYLPFKL